ncbi:unnamed protein product [Danaus chrysippus]|uniref:(African queen) hypothetical protein n=1 Tax=Danaus chrysippus TaxID=151541 RepID=A0A8J2VV37_9NEOP|nr:unnamed protein product [Danaus chrysippus]
MVFKKIKSEGWEIKIQSMLLQKLINEEEENKKCCKRKIILGLVLCLLLCFLITGAIIYEVTKESWQATDPETKEVYFNISNVEDDKAVVSCYYTMPGSLSSSELLPSDIHSQLCTHINVAFAQIINKEIYLDNVQRQIISEVVNLKKKNPNLKVLLSIGGAGAQDGFSDMVVNHTSRKIFIKSVKHTLRNYTLDGIDLDWEFPAVKDYQNKLNKRERQHFSQLLREIRAEYVRERKDYLLTVAVAAQQIIVDAAYDVDQINMYVDYANIMTYDFHYYTQFTPFTGFNAPLFARASEQLYMATLNINYTVEMYKNKGLDASKIVVGIPTYGHSFTLVNENNTNVGSPSSGFGELGSLGFVNYPDICTFINTHENNNLDMKRDQDAKVPYLSRNSEWVSYDDTDSVIEKAKFIRKQKLRGAMIYSLNADDYKGVCRELHGQEKFPLSESVRETLKD